MASRIAQAATNNDQNLPDNFIAKSNVKKSSKWDKNLIIHYTHEARFTTLKRDIHELWNEMLKNPITNDIRLIIGHRNNKKLSRTLMSLKPAPEAATVTMSNGETGTTTTNNN